MRKNQGAELCKIGCSYVKAKGKIKIIFIRSCLEHEKKKKKLIGKKTPGLYWTRRGTVERRREGTEAPQWKKIRGMSGMAPKDTGGTARNFASWVARLEGTRPAGLAHTKM